MKKTVLFIIAAIAITLVSYSQAPQTFKYQAVARDAGGNAITNTAVGVQFQLRQTTATGVVVYSESHSLSTNEHGIFSVAVGNGTPLVGAFAAIDWSAGPYYLEVGLDPAGGSNYITMGSQQLLSVPYALFSGGNGFWQTNGTDIYNTNSGRIGVGTTTPGTVANTTARVEIADEDGANSGLLMRAAGSGLPYITLAKQNGTLASPLAIDPDAWTGVIDAMYYNGSSYGISSRILMQADGTTNGTDYPGAMNFLTTPAESNSPLPRLTIKNNGAVGIGTSTPEKLLDVNGDALIHGLTLGRGNGDESTNSAIGDQALNSNTIGTDNTAIGSKALYSNTSGPENTATGAGALYSNTEGFNNTASGKYALYSNTTGNVNTAIGADALYSNTEGFNNTASGKDALFSNTTGENNTASGAAALQANITGNDNTASGAGALQNNTIGIGNTSNGAGALYSNTEGSYNTAGGKDALGLNTIGENNTAIGARALRVNTTGSSNVVIGYETLNSSVTSSANTAVGGRALKLANGLGGNTALGFQAGSNTTTGTDNVIVGRDAFINNTTGSNNTAVGFAALNANTTGTGNTAIGFGANVSSGDLTNATAIGYYAQVGASNALVLGGTGVNSVNVGIGTSAPDASAKLELSSNNKGFLPPRMYEHERSAISSPDAGLIIWCYDCGKYGGELQTYNGDSWRNMTGGAAADHFEPVIGEPYLGGIIAYLLQPLDPGYDPLVDHGIIAAASDYSDGYSLGSISVHEWGCDNISIPGADGTALGTGAQNTLDIVNGCSELGISAKNCDEIVLDGYSDWYLPSKDELNKLFVNRVAIGGFTGNIYWSSSEFSINSSWVQSFNNGSQVADPKMNQWHVRAIRSF